MVGGLLTGPYKLEHYRCEVSRSRRTPRLPGVPRRGAAGDDVRDGAPARSRRARPQPRSRADPSDQPRDAGRPAVHLRHAPRARQRAYPSASRRSSRRSITRHSAPSRRSCAPRPLPRHRLRELQRAHGPRRAASAGRDAFRTGHEGATVRMDPSGAVTVLAGVTSQGSRRRRRWLRSPPPTSACRSHRSASCWAIPTPRRSLGASPRARP